LYWLGNSYNRSATISNQVEWMRVRDDGLDLVNADKDEEEEAYQ
jgi:hypothetical protein